MNRLVSNVYCVFEMNPDFSMKCGRTNVFAEAGTAKASAQARAANRVMASPRRVCTGWKRPGMLARAVRNVCSSRAALPAPWAAGRLTRTRLIGRDHRTRPRRTRKRPWRVFALSEERGQRMAETMAAGQDLKAIERLRDAQR